MSVYTRGRDPVQLLRYEADRRPELGALVARAHELTDAEIAGAGLPLPWMRNALTLLRDRAVEARARGLQKSVFDLTLQDYVVDSRLPDPVGVLYEFRGPTQFVPSGRTEIEVPTGKLFLVCGETVYVEAAICRPSAAFMAASQPLRSCTRAGYAEAIQDRLRQLHPSPEPTVCLDAGGTASGDSRQPLAHLGVRIQR